MLVLKQIKEIPVLPSHCLTGYGELKISRKLSLTEVGFFYRSKMVLFWFLGFPNVDNFCLLEIQFFRSS